MGAAEAGLLTGAKSQIDSGISMMTAALTTLQSSQDPSVQNGATQLHAGLGMLSGGLGTAIDALMKMAEQAP